MAAVRAFSRAARDNDRPLLVSVGYSACHWCHVMERESFEDPQIAELVAFKEAAYITRDAIGLERTFIQGMMLSWMRCSRW